MSWTMSLEGGGGARRNRIDDLFSAVHFGQHSRYFHLASHPVVIITVSLDLSTSRSNWPQSDPRARTPARPKKPMASSQALPMATIFKAPSTAATADSRPCYIRARSCLTPSCYRPLRICVRWIEESAARGAAPSLPTNQTLLRSSATVAPPIKITAA
jgi:hypothetical protein